MYFLKHHKELIPVITVAVLLGIAAHDLFSNQQDNSDILNSGKLIDPATINGRIACEVAIPDISKREENRDTPFDVKEITN